MTESQIRAQLVSEPALQIMPSDGSQPWAPAATYLGAAGQQAAPAHQRSFGRAAAPSGHASAGHGTPRGVFDQVATADVLRRSDNISEGDYVARVNQAEYRKARNGEYVIVELKVLVSTYDTHKPETHGCNREGSTVSVFVKHNDNFASNMKEIMLAVCGFDEQGLPRPDDDRVEPSECDAFVSESQPFAGATVFLRAREVPTRAGGLFTRVQWYPCPLKADGNPDLDKLAELR